MERRYVFPGVSLGTEFISQTIEDNFSNLGFQNLLDQVEVGIDLGCGRGKSTQALVDLCPNLKEVHAVDLLEEILPDDFNFGREVDLTTYTKLIGDFLKEASSGKITADLVLIASVPTHYIQYPDLSGTIKNGGLVIEIGDTYLDQDAMRANGFALLSEKLAHDPFIRYWRRD
jgi:trans-aconitate methyltransferase